MIATADLREMPSSLNDACRKMDLAADCIDLLRLRVTTAEGEVASLKQFVERFGRQRDDGHVTFNEACRANDRLREKLTAIHQITQDPNPPTWDKIDNIAATALSALFPHGIEPEAENNIENDYAACGVHMPGVTE